MIYGYKNNTVIAKICSLRGNLYLGLLAMAVFVYLLINCLHAEAITANGGSLDYINYSKNLGLGFKNPQAKLHVNGSILGLDSINGALLGNADALEFNGASLYNPDIYYSSAHTKLDFSNGFTFTSNSLVNPVNWNVNLEHAGDFTVQASNKFQVFGSSASSPGLYVDNGKLGINSSNPSVSLHINGQMMIRGGSPAQGSILSSDNNGLASWISPTALASSLDASTLNGINSSSFLRSDIDENYTTGSLTFDAGTDLVLDGNLSIQESSAPSSRAGYGKLYVATDSNLYFLDSSGNPFLLGNGTVYSTGSGNPGGTNGTIQFNNSGVFAGSKKMIYDKTKNAFGFGFFYNGNEASGDAIRTLGYGAVSIGDDAKSSGNDSVAIGAATRAVANNSLALGYSANASGTSSVAIGNNAFANNGSLSISTNYAYAGDSNSGVNSIALGSFIRSNGDESIVIGTGVDENNYLDNNSNGSLMIGFNSTIPTLFASSASSATSTGNIGIANTNPVEKLTLDGIIALKEIQSPADRTSVEYQGHGKLYVGLDSNLYFLNSNGDEILLNRELVTTVNGASSIDELTDGKTEGDSFYLGFLAGASSVIDMPTSMAVRNTAVGYEALTNNVNGSFNTALGYQALFSNTADLNTAIGSKAGRLISTGIRNTAVGFKSMEGNGASVTGSYNSGLGAYTLHDCINCTSNTAIGSNALRHNSYGDRNVAAGYKALFNNVNGDDNVAVGTYALMNNINGSYNVAYGHSAGYNLSNGNANVILGSHAGYGNGGSFEINNGTIIGYKTGFNLATGADNNILIGYKAGDSLTTGSNNILIGNEVDTVSPTDNYKLNIADLIYGDVDNGNIGISVVSPKSKLDIGGVLKTKPTDSPGTCNSDLKGGLYYDASLNEPCYCNGSNWTQFDGGGSC